MPSPNSNKFLWIILALALAIRVVGAIGLQHWLDGRPGQRFLIEGDANGYWHLAEDLAAGREFAIYEPPRYVLRMPGFPALLSIPIRVFDNAYFPARILLACVGTCACGLVYVLGRMLFDHHVGLIAAVLSAISPILVGFTPLILSETTFGMCLLASLAGMAWMATRSTARQPDVLTQQSRSVGQFVLMGLVVGALIGITCYVRPSWLLSAPLFGGAYVMFSPEKGRALVGAACIIAGAVALLIPWGMRNERVTGHFVLTTLWMGPSLYDGLSPEATGESDMTFYDRDNLQAGGMSEYEVNRYYSQQAWSFARANPGRAIELAAIKVWRYFKPWPNAEQFGGWLPSVVIAAFTIPMYLLALRGWWVSRTNVWAWGLTVGPLLYFAGLHMLFVSSLRYRLPAEYPLLVMSAVGWQSLRGHQSIPQNPT
ncbi:MAG: hypothetical protein KDA86_19175 [Planctomycetaceae bacterium]|nr:hypothetical protein [Planctomycetaceae bacterium]